MKRILILFAALLVLFGCQNKAHHGEGEQSFLDDYGRMINTPTNPQRVVSVSPAVTEIMFDLGAGELLVGRTDFCNYPEEALAIESIGGISNLNIEKIISLNPDLVISGSMVPETCIKQLADLGIPVVCIIEKEHFENLYENIARIGTLIGRQRAADSLNNSLKAQISVLDLDYYERYNGQDDQYRPTMYYVVGFGKGGDFTAGANTFINEIIHLAGGKNIAEHNDGWSFSREALLNTNPTYIIIRDEDADAFCRTAPYNKLAAVRLGNIIRINSGMIDLQVPRNIEAIKIIHAAIQ